ncbi:MAG: hypothetical protein QXP98_03925 [Thermoproteus sp.]
MRWTRTVGKGKGWLYMTGGRASRLGRCVKWDGPDLAILWPIREGAVVSESSKCLP